MARSDVGLIHIRDIADQEPGSRMKESDLRILEVCFGREAVTV